VGGGPLAGIAARLAPEFNVPLLDGLTCAIRRAEQLVRALRTYPL
ncbi:MAG: aspartate/glutamate racemase family protein, partial [Acidobacteria bacterium]|nr:aspartate/glutamate racemase family protein [Acidobacteriota bacterium]